MACRTGRSDSVEQQDRGNAPEDGILIGGVEERPRAGEVTRMVLVIADMDFAHRLVALRKEQGLTQQALADRGHPRVPGPPL